MTRAKPQRQGVIRRLITSGRVRTQAELSRELRGRGLAADQSTLSRDLAELDFRKVRGRYQRRRMPEAPNGSGVSAVSSAVLRFVTCGPHLIVVRTTTGQAQPVALAIDAMDEPAVEATLAGDDTIFLATRNRRSQVVALKRMTQWFGDKHEF